MAYAAVFWLVSATALWQASQIGGAGWLLAWPALSFALAGAAYAGLGPRVFGKQPDGTLAIGHAVVLLPYLLFTWALWHAWRLASREAAFHELGDGIIIGRRLLPGELPPGVTAVFDLTSEFPEPGAIRARVAYRCLPTLDSGAPDVDALRAMALEVRGSGSGVYIHCANGSGRTGTLAAAFLMLSRRLSPAEAVAQVQARRPFVALKGAQRAVLDRLAATARSTPP
jgi:hypothetical protein